MNLAQLYYFRKLAQLEHYTKTAQELFISQPSLSSSIAAMEDELQIKLFQKKGRNVKLTKDGKEFYGHVCRALDALQDGIDCAHEKNGTLGGSIDIAAQPSLLLHFVPDLLSAYRNDQPSQVKFNLFNVTCAKEIADGIADGTYDFGFCAGQPFSDTVCAVPILPQTFGLYVAKSHPFGQKSRCTLADLRQLEVMTYGEQTENGQLLYPLLQEHFVPVSHTFSDEFSVNGYLSQNDNLAVLAAKSSVLEQCHNLVFLPIEDLPENLSSICLLYSRKNHITRPMERFLAFVKGSYRQSN